MRTPRKRGQRVAAKGDRLNWIPLKEVKPVKLSSVLVKGHILTSALKANSVPSQKSLIVP
jgi:hypothetical protein